MLLQKVSTGFVFMQKWDRCAVQVAFFPQSHEGDVRPQLLIMASLLQYCTSPTTALLVLLPWASYKGAKGCHSKNVTESLKPRVKAFKEESDSNNLTLLLRRLHHQGVARD